MFGLWELPARTHDKWYSIFVKEVQGVLCSLSCCQRVEMVSETPGWSWSVTAFPHCHSAVWRCMQPNDFMELIAVKVYESSFLSPTLINVFVCVPICISFFMCMCYCISLTVPASLSPLAILPELLPPNLSPDKTKSIMLYFPTSASSNFSSKSNALLFNLVTTPSFTLWARNAYNYYICTINALRTSVRSALHCYVNVLVKCRQNVANELFISVTLTLRTASVICTQQDSEKTSNIFAIRSIDYRTTSFNSIV